MRYLTETPAILPPGELSLPGYSLHKIEESDGETVRNLKLKAIHCGWLEFVGQNGETFRVNDDLL